MTREHVAITFGAMTKPAANWAVTPGAPTEAAYAEQAFTFTGAPFNIANNGDQIKITPKITLE